MRAKIFVSAKTFAEFAVLHFSVQRYSNILNNLIFKKQIIQKIFLHLNPKNLYVVLTNDYFRIKFSLVSLCNQKLMIINSCMLCGWIVQLFNILLRFKSLPNAIGDCFCTPIIYKNPINPIFPIRKVLFSICALCVGIETMYFLFKKIILQEYKRFFVHKKMICYQPSLHKYLYIFITWKSCKLSLQVTDSI